MAFWKFREGCTSALVYRCTKECRVSQHNLLAFVLCSFSLDCISCSHKEMCDTPIGTTRWFTSQDWNGLKKLMYSRDRGDMVTGLTRMKFYQYSLILINFPQEPSRHKISLSMCGKLKKNQGIDPGGNFIYKRSFKPTLSSQNKYDDPVVSGSYRYMYIFFKWRN